MKFKWYVGIDISKKTLDVSLYDQTDFKKSKHFKTENNRNGFGLVLKWLKNCGVQAGFTIFCMEHTGIYGVDLSAFMEDEQLFYSMVSPLQIKRSLGLTRGKNDKVDSIQIARYCYLHRKDLKLSKLPSRTIQKLRDLLNERERVVKMRTSDKQFLKEFSAKSNISTKRRVKQRISIFTNDIKLIENEIEEVIKSDPDVNVNYNLTKSVTGIGLVNAVIFIIYSNNFGGITDARKYACYGGVAPFENTSGTSVKGKTRVSYLANKRIKVNLSNAARSAIQNDAELRLYYNRKAIEGKEHGVIMNAVKFKLIARVFAVVNRKTPFVKMRQAG